MSMSQSTLGDKTNTFYNSTYSMMSSLIHFFLYYNQSTLGDKTNGSMGDKTNSRFCFAFQKGNCARGTTCKFVHNFEEQNVDRKNEDNDDENHVNEKNDYDNDGNDDIDECNLATKTSVTLGNENGDDSED